MKYKKWLAVLTAAFVLEGAIAVFGATENDISNMVKVNRQTTLDSTSAPRLTIETDENDTGAYSFELVLDKAEWRLGESGTFAEGVHYIALSENTLLVKVDETQTPIAYIQIPLVSEIMEPGDVTVSINGINSPVTSETFVYAKYYDGQIDISSNEIRLLKAEGTLSDVTISDTTSFAMKEGEKLRLELSSGFHFAEDQDVTVETTGKFEGGVSLLYDEESSKIIYLEMDSDTGSGSGKIVLSGLKIAPSANALDARVYLTLGVGNDEGTIHIADYEKPTGAEAEKAEENIVIDELDPYIPSPEITGTWEAGRSVRILVDHEVWGIVTVDENGVFTLPYPKDKQELSLGEHNIVVEEYLSDYTDSRTSTEMSFEILGAYQGSDIVLAIGSDIMSIGGVQKQMDAKAYISESGSTMLPVRAMANVLGISDESIAWNGLNGTVTITKDDGSFIIMKVGESTITDQSGNKTATSSPAEIKDGRMYLPMRSLLNAFGVEDDQILWSPSAKTVTIRYDL